MLPTIGETLLRRRRIARIQLEGRTGDDLPVGDRYGASKIPGVRRLRLRWPVAEQPVAYMGFWNEHSGLGWRASDDGVAPREQDVVKRSATCNLAEGLPVHVERLVDFRKRKNWRVAHKMFAEVP